MSKMMEQKERGCMGCPHLIIIPSQLTEYCDLDGDECTHGKDASECTIEILLNGIVHYRRPADHPDIKEVEGLIAKGNTRYSIRKGEGDD